jgi:hypothetical protein
VARLNTFPLQTVSPSQASTAPDADAADGPAANRFALTGCACPSAPGPASANVAPGPLDADDTDRASHPPVAPVHRPMPFDVRGFPFATAPSQAELLVRTTPVHVVPASHDRVADDDDIDDGPVRAWPFTGLPVLGSITM